MPKFLDVTNTDAARAVLDLPYVDPRDFGGKGDTKQASGSGTLISAGSTSLTLSGATFTPDDVGKVIMVPRAGKSSHTATVGNGSATTITITHDLNTRDVTVTATLVAGGAAVTNFTITKTTSASVTLTFASAPASNAVSCVVQPALEYVQPLVTTIAAWVTSKKVTLTDPAQTTVNSTSTVTGDQGANDPVGPITTTNYVSWGTDDTAALQAALAAVPGGGVVQLPPGVWTYSQDLVLKRGTVLRGAGMIQPQGGFLNPPRLKCISPTARIFIDDQCHITNLTVDGSKLGRWAIQSGNPTNGTGGNIWSWVANKFSLISVHVVNFVEAGFVIEAGQNSYMLDCTVLGTPIGFWFLHGAANFDLVQCGYDGNMTAIGAISPTWSRAVLIKADFTDPRLMEGQRTIANPNYEPWAGPDEGGARDIRFWGGGYEEGAGKYQIEISDSAPTINAITFNGAAFHEFKADSLVYIGPNCPYLVLTLRDCGWFNPHDMITAESGMITLDQKQTILGGQQSMAAKIKLSGTAQVYYYEYARMLMYCTFESGLRDAIGRNEWTTYAGGTRTWDSTKKCMSISTASQSSGASLLLAPAFPSSGDSHVQAGRLCTLKFRISNATGPVLLRARLSSGLRTIGTYGNGSHELVYAFVGDEVGFVFTSGAGGAMTADVNYFFCEHSATSGAYPPALQTWDGVLVDAAGNEWLGVVRAANAANFLQIANRAAGNGPRIIAAGDDTDINIDAETKGTGQFRVNTVPVALNSTTSTHTAQQIELGHASDTTITRLSAGRIGVEGIPLVRRTITSISGAFAVPVTSGDQVVLIDSGGLPTLGSADGATAVITLKNRTSAGVLIATTSSQTIEGISTYTLPAGQSITVVADSTKNWSII